MSCQYYKKNGGLIVYVDGGSRDGSAGIARSRGCECIEIVSSPPTPGRQRNAGWRRGSAELVQFLDSDTVLDPEWLDKAVAAMRVAGTGAVNGDRRESRPGDSVFNWIGDLEWNGDPGESEAFGGDVLISRAALEATGGYDPRLIAGEDPELSYRIRRAGYKIIKLDAPMTRHDLAMLTLRQYWKRSFRSGHAYAEVHSMHAEFWGAEVRRILLRTLPLVAAVACAPMALISPWFLAALPVGLAILIRPRLFLTGKFERALALSLREARTYSWHASLVVLPQLFGMIRFRLGRILGRPMENRRKPGAPRKVPA